MEKKGVSPIIATVLLIGIVIVLAVIIYTWASSFIEERAQKFGRDVALSCQDINFEAGVFCGGGCSLDILNNGDIPLYGFEIKEISAGTVLVRETVDQGTINIGDSDSFPLEEIDASSIDSQLLIIPVILGDTDSGKAAYTCPDENGVEVTVKALAFS